MKISKKDYYYIMQCRESTFDSERHKVVYQCISHYDIDSIITMLSEKNSDTDIFYYSIPGTELFFRR